MATQVDPAVVPSLLCLSRADLYAPARCGLRDVLVGGGRVLRVAPELPRFDDELQIEEVDLDGARLIPGLIDGHAHLTGGGGEAGYASRVPPLGPARFWSAGITSAVGVLGTDDTTRSPVELVTTARGLREEGLGAWCHTGGYHVPPATVTGGVRSDLALIDPVIGVGEVAISDHRSSQPTLDEILRLAADAHVGGLMTGKAGVLHLHLGDGERGLELIRRALAMSELPARVFHPTHVNRRAALWREACDLTSLGCTIDVTAFPPTGGPEVSSASDDDELDAHVALLDYFAQDLPEEQVTVSSDGGGCLPHFDDQGRVAGWEVGDPGELLRCLGRLLAAGLELERALLPFTRNPASLLRLEGRGVIEAGSCADLVVLRPGEGEVLAVQHVLAGGRWCVRDGEVVRRGRFGD